MDYSIKKAQSGDEFDLAYIQTESWKAAFKNILSDEVMEQTADINRAAVMYKRLLDKGDGNGYILEVNGKPHCIAWWDNARDEDMQEYAELICIHSLQDNRRKGYGTKMMERVLADIKASGYSKVMLWVFTENNRAKKFYESCGFVTHGKVKPGFGTQEICYEKDL